MLSFQVNKKNIELEFNSIKIIQTDFTTKIIRDIISSNTLEINNTKIKESNIIYLNDLSKISSLISFNKNSNLVNSIVSQINQDESLINFTLQENIKTYINSLYKFSLIDSIDGDLVKIINNSFEIKDSYLDFNIFYSLLEHFYFGNNFVFIFDNVSWLNKSNIKLFNNFLNNHSFIIFSNSFISLMNTISDFELLTLVSSDYEYVDIIDVDKTVAYLEKELSLPINNEFLNTMLIDTNSFESIKFISLFKKLITFL